MNSVFKLSSSRLALLAAFGLAASFTPVAAADLGGDCCADLEERIAELEATTARKGNRKVSLTISGWVNEGVFWWNDGHNSNVFVGTNDLEQTRVRFTGEAKIADGYSAGYTLEIGSDAPGSNGFSQSGYINSSGQLQGLVVRKSNWWLKSKDYGKVTVGVEGTATYHLLDDADIANTRNFYDAQADGVYQRTFRLRGAAAASNSALTWSNVMRGPDNNTPGQSTRLNIIRYDTPTIAGFTASAAWGADDVWDVALTYTGQWNDFKMIARGGYGQGDDNFNLGCNNSISKSPPPVSGFPPSGRQNCDWMGAAGSVMHIPTGIYVYSGWGRTIDSNVGNAVIHNGFGNPNLADENSDIWFIQAGIEQKWTPLGKTTIYGEYRHDEAGSNPSVNFTGSSGAGKADFVQRSDLNFWAVGAVQNVDAAAMDLYLMYRQADGQVTFAQTGNRGIDTFEEVIGGALIKF